MRNSPRNYKPNNKKGYSALSIALIGLNVGALIYAAFIFVSLSMGVAMGDYKKEPIVLPPNVSAIEVNNKDWRYKGKDTQCFHLVRAANGEPDYVLGECR